MKKLAIFGIGGFSTEVLDIAIDQGYEEVIFLTDYADTQSIAGFRVKAETDIPQLDSSYDFAIGIGDGKIRERIYKKYSHLSYPNLIHSTVTYGYGMEKEFTSSKGLIFAAGVRLNTAIELGNFVVISLNTTIGHDSIIEDFVSIMPGVNVAGNVHFLNKSYIGIGATILQGKDRERKMMIGQMAVVGAGSVVINSVKERAVVVGVPAKELVHA